MYFFHLSIFKKSFLYVVFYPRCTFRIFCFHLRNTFLSPFHFQEVFLTYSFPQRYTCYHFLLFNNSCSYFVLTNIYFLYNLCIFKKSFFYVVFYPRCTLRILAIFCVHARYTFFIITIIPFSRILAIFVPQRNTFFITFFIFKKRFLYVVHRVWGNFRLLPSFFC